MSDSGRRFQSAPLTEARGDLAAKRQREADSLFQSAPLTEARGDVKAKPYLGSNGRFQSAPLTEARGDPSSRSTRRTSRKFQSAPLTEARGDLAKSLAQPIMQKFQSAPLTEARGDRQGAIQVDTGGGFNPLPSPKQGETLRLCCGGRQDSVSIRSPHRSKGRPRPVRLYLHLVEFQSAPLTEARGDIPGTTITQRRRCFNPLPSPKQGETRTKWSG